MEQLRCFGDDRNKGYCIHCGGPDERGTIRLQKCSSMNRILRTCLCARHASGAITLFRLTRSI